MFGWPIGEGYGNNPAPQDCRKMEVEQGRNTTGTNKAMESFEGAKVVCVVSFSLSVTVIRNLKPIDVFKLFTICTLNISLKGLIPLDLPAEEMKKLASKRIRKGVDEYLIVVQVTKIYTFSF